MTIDRLFHDLSDIIKHCSSSLRCFFVPSVRAYATFVSAVVRFAISLLYSSWVISPFARSSHLMRTIRGFLEGFALLVNNGAFGHSASIDESFELSLEVLIAGMKTLEEHGDNNT